MGKVTEYGYVRSTLQDLLTSIKTNWKSKLGDDWNLETGSPEDQIISVFAEELDQVEQGIEGVVASQTLSGAEGIFLDDLLSQQGVFRQGKTAGGGQVVLFSNYQTVALNSEISTSSTISANNGITYSVDQTNTIDTFMACYKLAASDLVVGSSYVFSMYNTESPSTKTFTWTVISDLDKDRMLQNLVVFANDNITNKPSICFFDATQRTMFVGFNQTTRLPLPFPNSSLFVQSTPRVGSIGTSFTIKANEVGFYPLSANNLVNISPIYTGYQSIQNYDDLNSGTEVQTDVEYLYAANSIEDTSIAGTPNSIKSGLLRLEGVIDAEVIENPTKNVMYDVSNNTVCEPLTYNVIVLGGDDQEVAQVIYEKSPANTKRFGSYVVTARNYKDQSVLVNFTRCSYFDLAINVDYKTKDNTPLNEQEKAIIINNLVETVAGFSIGDIVSTQLLQAITFQSVALSRLKQVVISIKDLTQVGSSFTFSDLTADYDEKPRLLAGSVTFARI